MNYDKILSVAGANKQATCSAQIKRYSTEISAPKKPPKNGVQSDAVKAFLERKKKEEEMKARQAEHRKQELLELRAIARNGRKANAMAKRTKDNNFMRNFEKTAELADVSRERNGRSGPQWCSVKPKNRDTNDYDCGSPEAKQPAPKRPPMPQPPPNFYDLLKVAAKKQHEPLPQLPRIPKKKDVLVLEEQGRMMTVEEKRRFIEEQARKQGKSLTEVVIPKKTRKRYVPGQEIDSYEVAVKPTDPNRDPTTSTPQKPQLQSQQSRLKPSSVQAKQTESNVRKAPPDDRRKVNGQRPITNPLPPPPPQERRKYYPDVMPKKQKLETDNYDDDRIKVIRNGSSSSKPVSSQLKKQQVPLERTVESKMKVSNAKSSISANNKMSTSQSEVRKPVTKPTVSRSSLPNNVSSPSTLRDREPQLKPRSQLPSKDSQNRALPSRDSQNRTLPSRDSQSTAVTSRDSQNRALPSRDSQNRTLPSRDSQNRTLPSRDSQSRALPSRDSQNRPLPSRDSQNRPLPSRDSQNRALPSRDSQNRALPSRDSQNRALPSRDSQNRALPSRDSQNRQLSSRDTQNRPLPSRDSQNRPLPSRDSQNRPLPSRDSQNRPLPSRDSQNRPLPSRDSQNRPLPSRDSQNRPLPSRDSQNRQLSSRDSQNRPIRAREPEVRQFPPRDLMPRQFPPRDVVRRPMQRPPMKRRIESDDEEEYDEEMDDFIDDGPIDGENMNYSEHIKEIFGYDRSKYRYMDDDDMCMESSYLQQMKEEAISAKLGILEDLEDIQREEQEMRRKAAIRKKKK